MLWGPSISSPVPHVNSRHLRKSYEITLHTRLAIAATSFATMIKEIESLNEFQTLVSTAHFKFPSLIDHNSVEQKWESRHFLLLGNLVWTV